jgi:hypothetical protein
VKSRVVMRDLMIYLFERYVGSNAQNTPLCS